MSQKILRRTRRQTNDDELLATKASPTKTNGTPEEPQPAPPTESNNNPPTIPEKEAAAAIKPEQETKEPTSEDVITNGHNVEPEPVKETSPDEPEPELVFEELSETEIDRESPILVRCKTRRSVTRNATPKTPKVEEEPVEEELDTTFESAASTNAQVGGDSTRLDFTIEMNSFLHTTKDKTFVESLKHLSSRRSLRPAIVDFRKRVTTVTDGFVVAGKRKNEDEIENGKRFKAESPGFFARLSSPLSSIRHSFRGGEIASSTPKLTGYKDENCAIEEEQGISWDVQQEEKRWCSIM